MYIPAYFNSRPYARGDSNLNQKIKRNTLFQFTPLREGRQFEPKEALKDGKFQFTPLREGRLSSVYWLLASKSNFNSRPYARGDSETDQEKRYKRHLFQFTPLREGRLRPGVNPCIEP